MALKIVIAEAAHDEHGSGYYGYEGSNPGDQLQKHSDYSERYPLDDYRNDEVRFNSWYNKPWRHIYRPKDTAIANEIAIRAEQTVRNPNVGYSQPGRKSFYNIMMRDPDPSHISVKCECDCSSMVNTIVYATLKTHGISPVINGLEVTAEMASKYDRMCQLGHFTDVIGQVNLSTGKGLKRGDILLGDPATHTAVVLYAEEEVEAKPTTETSNNKGTVTTDLNLREGFGVNEKKITVMPVGSTVDILEEITWYRVNYKGKEGFCSAKYIKRA